MKKINDPLIVNIPLKENETEFTGLKVYQLNSDDKLIETVKEDRELCIVIISGYVDVKINDLVYENIGNRMTPFVEQAPYAFYITANDTIELVAVTNVEIALCYGIGDGSIESRIITPNIDMVEQRGTGQMKRVAKNILPETERANSLLIVEVLTDGGNWSSFPSHRHDTDDLPHQSYLEEIYYHKLNPSEGGFALQYNYNDNRTVNEVYVVENNKTVFVKEGYHPVTVPPGFNLYYLNIMAGPKRTWKFYNDPHFEKLLESND